MNKLLWIIGGCVLAAIAFIIPDQTGTLWTSLFSALAVAGLFILGLIIYTVRNSQSKGDLILGLAVLVLLATLASISGTTHYKQARWSYDLLTKQVIGTIHQGIARVHLNEPLLRTLESYHRNELAADRSLQQIFHERYGDALVRDATNIRYFPAELKETRDKPPFLYYDSTDTRNEVVLVGLSNYGNGLSPDFTNYDGANGNMQFKAVLTKKGVSYDREN